MDDHQIRPGFCPGYATDGPDELGHDDAGTFPVTGERLILRLFPKCVNLVGRVPAIHPPAVGAQMAGTVPRP